MPSIPCTANHVEELRENNLFLIFRKNFSKISWKLRDIQCNLFFPEHCILSIYPMAFLAKTKDNCLALNGYRRQVYCIFCLIALFPFHTGQFTLHVLVKSKQNCNFLLKTLQFSIMVRVLSILYFNTKTKFIYLQSLLSYTVKGNCHIFF
jgi:hypothetical protein